MSARPSECLLAARSAMARGNKLSARIGRPADQRGSHSGGRVSQAKVELRPRRRRHPTTSLLSLPQSCLLSVGPTGDISIGRAADRAALMCGAVMIMTLDRGADRAAWLPWGPPRPPSFVLVGQHAAPRVVRASVGYRRYSDFVSELPLTYHFVTKIHRGSSNINEIIILYY